VSRPRFKTEHLDQRDCALYYIWVLDPRTNFTTVCLGYVGETAREPFVRFLEHLYDQPFGDTIVGKPEVDPRRFAGKDEVWAAEKEAVERLRPLYNYEYNLDNPDRIPIPEARRQREARDRAKGVEPPTWDRPVAEVSRRRSYGWLASRPAGLVYLWLALAAGGCWASVHWAALAVADGAKVGVVGASFPFAVWWWRRLRRWFRRAGRRSRRRR
jgi:hypothetical protein